MTLLNKRNDYDTGKGKIYNPQQGASQIMGHTPQQHWKVQQTEYIFG
jgi:hypothetical protein